MNRLKWRLMMRAAEQCDKAVSLFHHRQRGFYKVRQCSNLTVREQSRCQMTSSSFPRIVRNVCICQQFRPEALNGAVNVLEDEWWHSYKLWHVQTVTQQITAIWKLIFTVCIMSPDFQYISLTLRSVLSPYLIGCSRPTSTSPPGLLQFSHRQP